MTQRRIDLALLAGIGVLLVAILFLALSAAPLSGGDIGDPIAPASQVSGADGSGQGATEPVGTGTLDTGEGEMGGEELGGPQAETTQAQDASDGSEVVGDPAVTDAVISPATRSDTTTNAGTATEAGTATPAAETTTDTTTDTATSTSLGGAEGATQTSSGAEEALERVGFAFVTGSMGACGMPLQPWQHVAVSRDLLDRYGCGATVVVTFVDEVAGRQQVTAQIGDTMGEEISSTVNVFVAQNEPALDYGVTEGTLQALSGSQ